MAIYRCSVKDNLTRSKGQSAVASAAYIAREKLHDERLGQTFNFARHDDKALWAGIYAPKDAPEWARDRQALWNEVEKAEKRKDAQIARPIEIALPHELTLEQNRYALQDFIRENFTRKGYVVDASIHSPSRDGDERNIHAHLLISLRTIDENGFSKSKQQEQENYRNKSAYTEALRESWERIGNRHLERHGHAPSLDRRTLAAQGIDREATKHRGPHVDAMERKGKQTERGEECRAIEERNRELAEARRDLAEVSKALAQEQRQQERPREPEQEPKQEQRQPTPEAERAPQPHGIDDSAAAFLKNREAAKLDKDAQRIEADRDRAPDMNRPALGGTVAQGFGMAASVATKASERLSSIADQLLGMLGPAPPPLTFRDYLNSKEARERHFQEQREQGERDATLWQIIADRRQGKDLNPDTMRDELRKLNRNDLEKIKTYGEDGLKQIIADHEREIQRQRERDRGRER